MRDELFLAIIVRIIEKMDRSRRQCMSVVCSTLSLLTFVKFVNHIYQHKLSVTDYQIPTY